MEVPISDLNEFEFEFDEICRQNAEDKDFYGKKYNCFNPEVHLNCFVQHVNTLAELRDALEMLDSHIEYLMDRGWELAIPIEDGFVMTMYTGEGSPPLEDSQFGEDGRDLEGKTIEDYDQEWDEDE